MTTQVVAPRMLQGLSSRPLMAGNAYKPLRATVIEVIQETATIKTIRVVLDEKDASENFTFEPGQVGQLSVFGA
ncbi:MAG: hypothetical protein J5803_05910, partial [Desulfovibrio sp.]|nr:hypothetical protein [Desulfovibrio sp.]